jgi:hypothetical protein
LQLKYFFSFIMQTYKIWKLILNDVITIIFSFTSIFF